MSRAGLLMVCGNLLLGSGLPLAADLLHDTLETGGGLPDVRCAHSSMQTESSGLQHTCRCNTYRSSHHSQGSTLSQPSRHLCSNEAILGFLIRAGMSDPCSCQGPYLMVWTLTLAIRQRAGRLRNAGNPSSAQEAARVKLLIGTFMQSRGGALGSFLGFFPSHTLEQGKSC